MDKEAFLHQMEYAVTNNNKKLFADAIFDLPADVIVGFTKEEFSRVIHISHHFSSQKMDRLFNFLEIKGLFFLKNALKGIDELSNYLLSKFYYSIYVSLSENNKERFKRVLINDAIVCCKLANMGIDSRENFETAVSLYGNAREILPKKSTDYALLLIDEGTARKKLAEMGFDSRENLETSVSLYGDAREILPKTSAKYALSLIDESFERFTLSEMGFDSRENLEIAVSLYGDAREILPETSENYALSLIGEGVARSKLADMGIDRKENLETAVNLCGDAREILPETSENYAHALLNEGAIRSILADMGIDSRENLETAVNLCGDAREIFPETSINYALALMNESATRSALAEMGIDRRENFETSVNLCGDAREIFPETSAEYAISLMREGTARSKLADMGIDSRENFERSKELYLESISNLEKLEDGGSYSNALLRFNDLLKGNFYKTGDKKYLEEWEENLGGIEKKIKARDMKFKELLMAKIHEIRASLLEFEGKSGMNKASREYNKAYELSKDPFYKFMDEFCQARIDTKSFCELVSDWKEVEKEDIFLDYFDYTVFECHLENALKRSIFRKDELESAREKLKEIGNRTQIKIIKDRVSAYVYLMNSLDFCFEQGSYEDAMENVRKACKIFHQFDDKPGCEMCECFNEALLENKNPESWRNVVQKIFHSGEFSSNFYRLLCDYSDRKRTTILQDLPLKIIENTSRIEEKIENIQKTLDQVSSACVLIKSQIEEGFEGTDAELRQIKEKINSIQQDLGNLVQISNDVGGKEGECIRKFASLMLELMKKGDYEALKRFSEKIVQNSSSIEEIIEAAEIPKEKKVKAKSKLVDLEKIPGILKKAIGNVTENVIANLISGEIANSKTIKIVSLASGEIIKLLIPVLSTAILGVPIPSKVVEMLLEAMRDS